MSFLGVLLIILSFLVMMFFLTVQFAGCGYLYHLLLQWLLGGSVSPWLIVILGAIAGFGWLCLVFLCAFINASMLKAISAPITLSYILIAIFALGLVSAAVYLWFLPPYTISTIIMRVILDYFFIFSIAWLVIMILMISQNR